MNEFNPTHTLIHAIQYGGVVYHAGAPVIWWMDSNRGDALVEFQNGVNVWTTENNLLMMPCVPTPSWVNAARRALRVYE